LIGVLVIAAAGCSSPPPASSPPDEAATTAWLNQVCQGEKAVYSRGTAVAKAPRFTQDRPPTEADREALITSLTELQEMFTRSKTIFFDIGEVYDQAPNC
jgi:hypothetical protein